MVRGIALASRREGRVTEAGLAGDASREVAGVVAPPPLIVGVPMLAALLLERLYPWSLGSASWLVPVGVGLLLTGLALLLPSIVVFRRARTHPEPWKPTKALVTGGLYRYTRNPMYLGMLLVYLGLTLVERTAWPLVALPAVILVLEVGVIRREERYLARCFGVSYEAYRRQVRRWL